MRKVRIGIDVGGTFTDAVAIDDATYEIIAQEKIPTTHDAKEGVADGIIKILQDIMKKNDIAPEEVIFIAHGTTQATNALLEGDVAKVGILAMGQGIESARVESDSNVGNIPLAEGKELQTVHTYLKTENAAADETAVRTKIQELRDKGAQIIVATESFSVDDPTNELFVMDMARQAGIYATGGHEVSQLYGLKVRTRTAVINGSLIPKMMETADMTEQCVKRAGIASQLMIMRCDGGVMTVNEVRRRPILTMLSGLAAGVAGALMYEKMSDGIFLEAGGTSTDISAVKNGRVMVKYAQVGGHKTYLNSLDVRTLGVAGGSMIRVEGKKITDVGPRSAHIAGLTYEVFSPALTDPHLELLAPCKDDQPVFAAVVGEGGKKVALTLAGAANVLGKIPKQDYATGDKAAARIAWQALGDVMGVTAEEAARQAMDIGIGKIRQIVEGLIHDYELPVQGLILAGGGGSAGVVAPYLGELMNCQWKIVKNGPIISTIGVALAMVREIVERTVVNPTDEDIRSIRREALNQIMKSGAKEATVEIAIEIDKQSNILRAIAMGATELRMQDLSSKQHAPEELLALAAQSMELPKDKVQEIATVGKWHVYEGRLEKRAFLFFKKAEFLLRVLDRDGIIRLRKTAQAVMVTTKGKLQEDLHQLIDTNTEYGTIGGQLPLLYIFYGEKQIDLSGLVSVEQIDGLLQLELDGLAENEKVIIVAAK